MALPLIPIALKLVSGGLWKRLGAFLGSIPRWVWIALGIALLALFAWRYVDHKIDAAYASGYSTGKKDENARLTAKAIAIAEKTNRLTAKVAAVIRVKTDENATRINVAADHERLLGPGKSALRCPGPASPASGPVEAGGIADDAGHSVPADQGRSVVPWGWLVSRAQTCDLNANEVNAWREWYDKIAKVWPKAQP